MDSVTAVFRRPAPKGLVAPEIEIRIFRNLEEVSRAAAVRFSELARRRAEDGKTFSAAVSGGETPKAFFRMLGGEDFQIPWERVHLFQVDERRVPPDHPESNYRMIRESLLSRVPQAAVNFHRMQAERTDLDAAGRDYAQELAAVMDTEKGRAPRLDLILLGMGSDGHTASLFPESPALAEQSRWARPNFVARLGTYRMTLTYPVLNAASEVIFLVSGEGKADTLRQVLEGPRRPEQLPSQGVRPTEGKTAWYVDEAAASLLNQVRRRNV